VVIRILRSLLLVAVASVVGGCSSDAAAPTSPGEIVQSSKARLTAPDVSPSERAQFQRDRAALAIDLYRAATASAGGENLFFSPHSISLALAMTWAGARGDTAAEMAAALEFTQGDRVHALFDDLDLDLSGAASNDFQLSIVNQLFGQSGEPFLPAYLDLVAENYGAGLRTLDFVHQADPARLLINRWVAEATRDRIQDLIPAGSIDSGTRLVLANAIYFNARWATPFPKERTQSGPFHTLAAGDAQVQAMHGIVPAGYATGAGYQAVELPYRGGRAAMLLIVPDAGRLADVEGALDAGGLAGMVSALAQKQVDLALPKISFETRLPVKQLLVGRGMKKAFDPTAADFSGLDAHPLFISDVLHKAFVRVDEEGTEAAAATAVVVGTTSVPQVDVTLAVDRPFILAVRDRTSGAILFIGRVVDPR